jgi:hypothetical protein
LRVQRRERRLFERLGDLEAGGAELLRSPLEDARARIFGSVDPMAEAHDPSVLLEDALHVALGVSRLRHLVEHRQDPCRSPAVKRAAESPDRT